MKYKIFTALALAGSALAELFGGWDQALQTLVIFIVRGKVILQSQGKEFFTWHGKDFFT